MKSIDIKDSIINKLGLRVGQLEFEKANIEAMYELLLSEVQELKNEVKAYEESK